MSAGAGAPAQVCVRAQDFEEGSAHRFSPEYGEALQGPLDAWAAVRLALPPGVWSIDVQYAAEQSRPVDLLEVRDAPRRARVIARCCADVTGGWLPVHQRWHESVGTLIVDDLAEAVALCLLAQPRNHLPHVRLVRLRWLSGPDGPGAAAADVPPAAFGHHWLANALTCFGGRGAGSGTGKVWTVALHGFWPDFDPNTAGALVLPYAAILQGIARRGDTWRLIADRRQADLVVSSVFAHPPAAKARPTQVHICISGETEIRFALPRTGVDLYITTEQPLSVVARDPARHAWCPHFMWHAPPDASWLRPRPEPAVAATRFCGFVVSNGGCAYRNNFFHWLSQYKRVDSAGSALNNMPGGYRVPGSHNDQAILEFYATCKFVMCFENTSTLGYLTEKLRLGFEARGPVPIYWGDPDVDTYMNPAAFVNVLRYPNMDAAIAAVMALDNDAAAYAEMQRAPVMLDAAFWPRVRTQLDLAVQNALAVGTRPGLVLVTSYHVVRIGTTEEARAVRQEEYERTLRANLAHPHVGELVLFVEGAAAAERLRSLTLPDRDKLTCIDVAKQPLYADFFRHCNDHLRGRVCMIVNSDIELAPGFNVSGMQPNEVYALTRHETPTNRIEVDRFQSSHDAFIFRAPLDRVDPNRLRFPQNQWGSESCVISALQSVGYRTRNPCRRLVTYHNHASALRDDGRVRIDTGVRYTPVAPE
jgi:hypothetical protein